MYVRFLILLFSCALSFFLSTYATPDTISANQTLRDGDTIVSDGGMYELGFFSPGNSKNRYLGIWYKKISTGTVVWVANRENPVTEKSSGMFKVSKQGTLLILSRGNTVIWSSRTSVSIKNLNPLVQLLDTGNLVVWDGSSNSTATNKSLIWQSFDYPGNTLLPGMKFGRNLVTGREWSLSSWKSPDDPSPGLCSHWVDTNGYPQMFLSRGRVLLSRFGLWNGVKFQGVPMVNPSDPVYSAELVINEEEIYYKYELIKSSVIQRIVVMSHDNTVRLRWNDEFQDWAVYGTSAVDTCGQYGLCGSYGSCNINKNTRCSCMKGFEPKFLREWNAGNWSGGCQRKQILRCGSLDGFQKISRIKFPDTRRSWYNVSMTLEKCEMACIMDCSCTAYANLDVRNGGSGCLLWFDDLMDMREYDEDQDQDLYIRIAASELAAGFNKKKRLLTVVLSTSSAVLLLLAVAYVYRNKKKRLHMKRRGNWNLRGKKNIFVQIEDVDELPFFTLYEILKATNNFSIDNKIGEGGFGPVYKGVLEDGHEVAVKRHSEASRQGLDEFKNELICITKLQHRNLVKLLGYCIHGNEMILIYEYMVNGSLDAFLFDETRSSMLKWPQRFHIIHGMARGILYIHQDSRLQIIHRDLKAGNILLDNDMNPKISDFGLARKFVGFDTADKTKKVVGTYGYISPEYAVHGRFSIKSDVFSFGVMVLEIVSGKRNREFFYENCSDNLLGHAWRLYKEGRSIELMSASLHDSCNISQVLRSIHVGLLCVQHHANDRPTMLSVVLMLVSEGALPEPKQPAFFTDERQNQLESINSLDDEYMITLMYAR